MREILYRARKHITKEWIYGTIVKYGFCGRVKYELVPHYASDIYGVQIIEETIGQFTGFTDKNGEKIFEGDILHAEGYWDIFIEFEKGSFMCMALNKVQYVNKTINVPMCNFDLMRLYEVIGSIHERNEQ